MVNEQILAACIAGVGPRYTSQSQISDADIWELYDKVMETKRQRDEAAATL